MTCKEVGWVVFLNGLPEMPILKNKKKGWTPYNLIFKRLRRENVIYFFLMLLILLYQPLSKYYREVMEVHQKKVLYGKYCKRFFISHILIVSG